MSVTVNKDHIKSLEKTDKIINKIYNDHEKNREEWIIQGDQLVSAHKHQCMAYEAQLKAKDELLDKLHKVYAEAEYECKAKDEKLKQLDDAYSKVVSDFESAIMEIHYLKTQMTGYSMLFDEPQDAKARSIVAMLFWKWKRRNRLYIENKYRNPSANLALYKQANLMQEVFQEAYKMLKGNE